MGLFNTVLIIIIGISLLGWISVFVDIKRRNFHEKYSLCQLNDSDITRLKYKISNMEGREFEKFCYYLFKKTGKYKDVKLTQEKYDGGKDLILTTEENEIIYVEAKRYTDRATKTEDFMIGREIVTKFAGTMLMDGVKHGIIITTGNIHGNAWEAIKGIEKKSNLRIEVIDMDMIIHMVKEACNSAIFDELVYYKGI